MTGFSKEWIETPEEQQAKRDAPVRPFGPDAVITGEGYILDAPHLPPITRSQPIVYERPESDR
jgi:hypothetical protein